MNNCHPARRQVHASDEQGRACTAGSRAGTPTGCREGYTYTHCAGCRVPSTVYRQVLLPGPAGGTLLLLTGPAGGTLLRGLKPRTVFKAVSLLGTVFKAVSLLGTVFREAAAPRTVFRETSAPRTVFKAGCLQGQSLMRDASRDSL